MIFHSKLMTRDKSHIHVLDTLRAFAALSVCLYHFVCKTTDYIHSEWLLSFFDVGKSGVQLFFVISGFVIPWSMYQAGYKLKNFFLFFLKRITRLEPPYIFSIMLALAVLYFREKLLGRTNDHMNVSAQQVLLHFGYLIPFFEDYQWLNQVYWTLAIEFQYYLFIALLFVPLVKSGRIQRFVIYSIVIALSFLASSSFLLYWLLLFLLGILLFLYKAELISASEYYIVTVVVLFFSLMRYPIVSVVYSVIPLVLVLKWQGLVIPVLHTVGKFSYSVYLVHPLVGASLINLLSHHFTAPFEKFLVICSGIILTLAFSWITYRLIEKPSRNLSASIKY